MKILITGGTGFMGKQLSPLLSEHGHEVTAIGSSDVRLDISEDVNTFFKENTFDVIIHAAVVGGRMHLDDDSIVTYKNLSMFENVYRHIDRVKMFINIDSGASFGRPSIIEQPKETNFGDVIPKDYYGFSKYCMARTILEHPKGINLRVFGCFGLNEKDDRFFMKNIKNYKNHKNIQIYKDRKMDFIYIKDFYQILNTYLNNNYTYKDLNCVYDKKYYLSEIANYINDLDSYKVEVVKGGEYKMYSYCGSGDLLKSLDLNLIGLEGGIRECYEYIC
jgi:nucleoside-diphosphate-sugar epimerase